MALVPAPASPAELPAARGLLPAAPRRHRPHRADRQRRVDRLQHPRPGHLDPRGARLRDHRAGVPHRLPDRGHPRLGGDRRLARRPVSRPDLLLGAQDPHRQPDDRRGLPAPADRRRPGAQRLGALQGVRLRRPVLRLVRGRRAGALPRPVAAHRPDHRGRAGRAARACTTCSSSWRPTRPSAT